MDNKNKNSSESGFGTLRVGDTGKVKQVGHDQTYNRAKLFNPVTQQREEITLIDLGDPSNENLMPVDSQLDLHADLTEAFSVFTTAQKRFLMRVLVQGQSVEEASTYSLYSRSFWAKWLHDVAMPVLRFQFRDYIKNGKVTI